MKYVNAVTVLPDELIKEIKKYVEGVYVYIPQNESKKKKWGSNTNTQREMKLRNTRIYDNYLEGNDVEAIAEKYYLSVKSIRRIILQYKREMEPVGKMVNEILKNWNIDSVAVQIHHSAWSINNEYVLKEYSDENSLNRNIGMIKTLYKANIPVPEVISLPSGEDYYTSSDKQYMLTTQLKGKNNIDLNQCDADWFYRFGTIIGELHLAFRECQKDMSFWNNSMLEEMKGWVSKTIVEFKPKYLAKKDVDESIDQLSRVFHILPKQLIHRDIHLGNFLFDEQEFSGYIDFDLSQSNIRIFDICYFLLGILSEGNNTRVNSEDWLKILKEVVNGYDSKLTLSQEERESVPCVMKNIELLFVAYFLSVDDEKMAEDAAKLFAFVKDNESRILDELM
ncbi:MAG: phosphotransferase [Clostridiales bacterium]|nr:phosphotransferase [Clostridiales bacterium]